MRDIEILNQYKPKFIEGSYEKLLPLKNYSLFRFIKEAIELCEPDTIFVSNGSKEDLEFIRMEAIKNGEESPLKIEGHTVHFDNYGDQGRDREHTGILVPEGKELGELIQTKPRESTLKELKEIMKGIMRGHRMYILFYTLGPENSPFSIPTVQITDSAYVAHSENILYRQGYKEFLRHGEETDFFRFLHSQGELDERKTSKNLDKRRVYIDLETDTVYSANTQYGGNTIGLKKLAMRLAINKASKEGWLTEHMLIMGIHDSKGRVTYITGAFPSMCGKTSTAMLEGETIIGDDIAYLRVINGEVRAVNVEKGVFGIIQGINSKDDPIQWKILHSPGEIIFSNVLVTEDKSVYWIGKDGDIPSKGINHSGEWYLGKKDNKGKEIPPSHPNARFTVSLELFENLDPRWNDPQGVKIGAFVYGGRDSDTSQPVEEAFDWIHGIITKGSCLESERTAAVLGEEGVREFNPMSNLDFLSITVGKYILDNINFGKDLKNPPKIFGVNYFLKDNKGRFLNDKNDKKIWLKWIALRVNGEVKALKTPTGLIPLYEDLRRLFKEVLGKDYLLEDYREQFKVRVREWIAKIDRMLTIYTTKVKDTPQILFTVLKEQRERLKKAQEKFGDYIYPEKLELV